MGLRTHIIYMKYDIWNETLSFSLLPNSFFSIRPLFFIRFFNFCQHTSTHIFQNCFLSRVIVPRWWTTHWFCTNVHFSDVHFSDRCQYYGNMYTARKRITKQIFATFIGFLQVLLSEAAAALCILFLSPCNYNFSIATRCDLYCRYS